MHKYIWEEIFVKLDLIKEECNVMTLRDPETDLVKGMLYIFSMQTFIYESLTKAARTCDMTKKNSLGPFARVMSEILTGAEYNGRPSDPKSLEKVTRYLFRGLTLPQSVINEWRNRLNLETNLPGPCSTSFIKDVGYLFALRNF